jgi:hypothetical protein
MLLNTCGDQSMNDLVRLAGEETRILGTRRWIGSVLIWGFR